jgi:hypothetical protein
VFKTRKVAGALVALLLISGFLALYPADDARAANLVVASNATALDRLNIAITGYLPGEVLTVCGTGGPVTCPLAASPAGGSTGTFISVSPATCGTPAIGGNNNIITITVSAQCFADATAGVGNCTPAASICLVWQCLSGGSQIFTLSPGGVVTVARLCSVAQGGGPVTVIASPNVLPCNGGTVRVVAFLTDQAGVPQALVTVTPSATNAFQTQGRFIFSTSVGLLTYGNPNLYTTPVVNGQNLGYYVSPYQNTFGIPFSAQPYPDQVWVTLYQGMGSATVTASLGGLQGSTTIQVFCPGITPTPVGTPVVTTPAPPGSLTLTASPSTIETCDGSLFLAATVKDANGKLVPDGTNVLFLATRGILDPASANTVQGTANVVYTSDLKVPGQIRLAAQAGNAYGSTTVDILCSSSGGVSAVRLPAVGGTPGPGGFSPNFTPPNTGDGIRIRPPSTGDAGAGMGLQGIRLAISAF